MIIFVVVEGEVKLGWERGRRRGSGKIMWEGCKSSDAERGQGFLSMRRGLERRSGKAVCVGGGGGI